MKTAVADGTAEAFGSDPEIRFVLREADPDQRLISDDGSSFSHQVAETYRDKTRFTQARRCPVCLRLFEGGKGGRGRPAIYCSRPCRNRASDARRPGIGSGAWRHCQACGSDFYALTLEAWGAGEGLMVCPQAWTQPKPAPYWKARPECAAERKKQVNTAACARYRQKHHQPEARS
jgi:hypothetical protein